MIKLTTILLLSLILFGSAAAAPITVDAVINATVNGSQVTLTYPSGVFPLNLAVNGTTEISYTLQVPSQNISVNLTPGGQLNVTGAYDVLGLYCQAPENVTSNATCAANITTVVNATCSSTQSLNAGQSWDQVGGACDLHFTCQPGTVTLANGTACPSPTTTTSSTCEDLGNYTNVTYYTNVTIQKTGSLFSVTLQNRTTLISEDFTNATQSVEVGFTCPLQITKINDTATADSVLNMCSVYMPLYMDWLNLTIHGCIDNGEAFREYLKTRDEVVAKANQDLSDCRADNGQKDGQILTLNSQVANLNDIVTKGQERDQIYVIVMSLMGFVIIALVVLTIVLAHRAGAEG